MEEILEYLRTVYKFSKKCGGYLESLVEKKEVRKNEILLRPGEISQDLYFIKKGLLRCYYLVDEVPKTAWFFWEQSTVVSIRSWYTQTPGNQYIQTLEDSELYYISYENLEKIYKRFPEFNYIGRVLTIKYLLIWDELVEIMRLTHAIDRYHYILKHRPEILLRVPLGDVATWLGMVPETLSRMRSNVK